MFPFFEKYKPPPFSRKNEKLCNQIIQNWNGFWSEACMEVIFCMTRFKSIMGLPDFTHLEFEEELNREHNNHGRQEDHVYRSFLLTQIIEVLLRKAAKNISVKELDVLLVQVAKREFKPNPFENMESCDFHALPTAVKLWVFQQLLHYHIDAEKPQTFEEWRTPETLRANTVQCNDGSIYYYFHDLRVFRFHHASIFERRRAEVYFDKLENAPWRDIYLQDLRGHHFECVASDHVGWAKFLKYLHVDNKKHLGLFRNIYRNHVKDGYHETLNRFAAQRLSRARQRAQMDVEKRRVLGLFRTSSRLQLKRKLEEEEEGEKGDDGCGPSNPFKQLSREERLMRREEYKEFKLFDNKLTIDVPSSEDVRRFDTPENTSPISLKEVNVENFRLTNPPISPQLTNEVNVVVNQNNVLPEVPKPTKPPRKPRKPRAVQNVVKNKQNNNPTPIRNETNEIAQAGSLNQLLDEEETHEDFTSTYGGKKLEETKPLFAPSGLDNPPVNWRRYNDLTQKDKDIVSICLSIRNLFRDVYDSWAQHYKKDMPEELEQLFTNWLSNIWYWPCEEELERMRKAIFETPVRIGKLDVASREFKNFNENDAQCRALARALMETLLMGWSEIFVNITLSDRKWLLKMKRWHTTAEQFMQAESKFFPIDWHYVKYVKNN